MNTARIEELQKLTAYPESHSVALALEQVWVETSHHYEKALVLLEADMHYFSTRPCEICRDISGLIGRHFGCIAKGESIRPSA